MPSVETFYLIDFENVHEDGLSGSANLGSHDHIYLFYTKNAPKISIKELAGLHSANLSTQEIPNGNQSLDMHLVSYLGYLIGTNINNKCKYVIISKDTDYDNIISFWKNKSGSEITRRSEIAPPKPAKAAVTPKSAGKADKETKTPNASKKKTQLNTEIQRALSSAGYGQTTISKTASLVVKHYGEENFADNIHNELKNTYHDCAKIYEIITPVLAQYSITPTKSTNTTTLINSKVQKLLSTAGFSNDIINPIASLVSKHHKEKNGKQTVYRSIVAKYGQKRGLNIYNHIKNSF